MCSESIKQPWHYPGRSTGTWRQFQRQRCPYLLLRHRRLPTYSGMWDGKTLSCQLVSRHDWYQHRPSSWEDTRSLCDSFLLLLCWNHRRLISAWVRAISAAAGQWASWIGAQSTSGPSADVTDVFKHYGRHSTYGTGRPALWWMTPVRERGKGEQTLSVCVCGCGCVRAYVRI